jgi:hypothetical protein
MGLFTDYFDAEHRALEKLIQGSTVAELDEFRRLLLRHVAVEEQIFLPTLVARLGHAPLYRASLTHDHAGLVALCAPTPQPGEWAQGLREQVQSHHAIEMAAGGFCEQCEQYLVADAPELMRRAEAFPDIELPAAGENFRTRIHELLGRVGLPSHRPTPPVVKPALQRSPPKRKR